MRLDERTIVTSAEEPTRNAGASRETDMKQDRLAFGLMLSNRGVVLDYCDADEMVRLAVTAEESGLFDSVWSGDSYLVNPRLDAITLLAAVAARTERVILGPACMGSFTLRSPLDLAIGWAGLDRISGGRSVMVACVGGGSGAAWEAEGKAAGVPAGERRPRMWERIQLLRRLWSEDDVTFRGQFHDYENLTIAPKPLRQPYPIWAATNVTRLASGVAGDRLPVKTLATIGALCDGWMTHSVDPDMFARAWDKVRAAAADAGRDPEALGNVLTLNICVNDDAETALAESSDFLESYYGIRFTPERTRAWTAFGTPDACAAQIRRYAGCGIQRIGLRITSRDQTGQLRRIVEEVLPKV